MSPALLCLLYKGELSHLHLCDTNTLCFSYTKRVRSLAQRWGPTSCRLEAKNCSGGFRGWGVWNLLIAIADWLLQYIFFANMLMQPPLHKKSRSVPELTCGKPGRFYGCKCYHKIKGHILSGSLISHHSSIAFVRTAVKDGC